MEEKKKIYGIGAVVGDIVGSPYEFDENNIKTEKFPLFSKRSYATDDTVMTLAVAEGLMRSLGKPKDEMRKSVIASMVSWGKRYPYAGYGTRFRGWFDDPVPYGSWGNGSAMRVSSVGWLFDDLDETIEAAELTAAVSHDHPDGIRGAQATAAAIWLNRHGTSKSELKSFIVEKFGYDLSRTTDEIRPNYSFTEECAKTVPEAITAYLEAESFEGTLRKAVSLGGDSDTLTAIAASIAEPTYEVPVEIAKSAIGRLDEVMLDALLKYMTFLSEKIDGR